jgi:hypothetical protein
MPSDDDQLTAPSTDETPAQTDECPWPDGTVLAWPNLRAVFQRHGDLWFSAGMGTPQTWAGMGTLAASYVQLVPTTELAELTADRDHLVEMLRQAREIHVQDRARAASSLQERDEVVRQLVELQEDNDRFLVLVNALTEHIPDYYAGDPLAVVAEWAADIASGDPERVGKARATGEWAVRLVSGDE